MIDRSSHIPLRTLLLRLLTGLTVCMAASASLAGLASAELRPAHGVQPITTPAPTSQACGYGVEVAHPPSVEAAAYACDPQTNSADPAAHGGRLLRAFSALDGGFVAPNGLADDVLAVCRRSFSADTEVLLGDGTTTKPISQIEIGDLVWAHDPVTGEEGARRVTALWVHDDEITDLQFANGSRVSTTEDHPFWNATDAEWQHADALDPGDLLLSADGDSLAVDGMDPTSTRTTTAFNLTVGDIHTYFVAAGDDEILVHNVPCTPGQSDVRKGLDNWRGKTKTNGLSGRKRQYYEWDYTHGDIEVYNSRGVHLGTRDPLTGEMIKPAVRGRTIDVS